MDRTFRKIIFSSSKLDFLYYTKGQEGPVSPDVTDAVKVAGVTAVQKRPTPGSPGRGRCESNSQQMSAHTNGNEGGRKILCLSGGLAIPY